MRYSIAHLWARGLCNIFIEVILILALGPPIFKPFSQVSTKKSGGGHPIWQDEGCLEPSRCNRPIILLHLETGAHFYVEKADFVGTFVPVYGGGDAANDDAGSESP